MSYAVRLEIVSTDAAVASAVLDNTDTLTDAFELFEEIVARLWATTGRNVEVVTHGT